MSGCTVTESGDQVFIIEVGTPGPPGAQGPAGVGGNNTAADFTAAEDIGAFRVVHATASGVEITDSSDTNDAGRAIGITQSSVATGNIVSVLFFGTEIDPSWSWTPGGDLFFDSNGVLTQVAPTTGFLQKVGTAITATQVFIDVDDYIILE